MADDGTGIARRRLLRASIAAAAVPAWMPAQARGETFWGRRLQHEPSEFIFGYGSLINSASRDTTAGTRVHAIPVRISASFGHVRTWNDRSASGFTALGLAPAETSASAATINGVLYPVDGTMDAFDAREAGYRRVEVPRAHLEAVSWQGLPAQGRVWAYIPEQGRAPEVDFPLLQSYIDVVLEGGLEYGPDFAREIIETTTGWSSHWLNDRRLARRPWVFDRLYQQVDGLLSASAPHFADRRFPETYGRDRVREPAPAAR